MTAQDTENSSANSLKQTMTTHGVGTTEMSDQKIWEKFKRKCHRGLWYANRLLQINVKPPLQTIDFLREETTPVDEQVLRS